MRRITVDDIMYMRPCSAWPRERVTEVMPRPMTVPEILRIEHVPPRDRLWVALRDDMIPGRALGLFACDCAERVISTLESPDPRIVNAVGVARAYVCAEATGDELRDALNELRDACDDAVVAATCTGSEREWYAAKVAEHCARQDRFLAAINASDIAADPSDVGVEDEDELRTQCRRLADIIEVEADDV